MLRASALLAFFALAGCGDVCGNALEQELVSPDGARKAVPFNRDCGATTSYSSQVSILDAKQGLSGAGNAFVADGNHGEAEVGQEGRGPLVEMRWLSPQKLLISYVPKTRIFKNNRNVHGVTISYQEITADH